MLREKLLGTSGAVRLYGTTPPRAGADAAAIEGAADKLAARLAPLGLDGVVVYDIQDETGRTGVPRPFPFAGTVDPRSYSSLLGHRTGLESVTYKCVGELDEPAWDAWLSASAREHGVRCLSVVGRPTSGIRYPLPLSRAIRLAAAHGGGFAVGGVAIAERHTMERSESARLLAKSIEGCGFFISQTVYHAEATVRLLADYARDCRGAGVAPRRVLLTFAPAGREKTLDFLRWLGVRIAPQTSSDILGSARPLARSIEICRANLERILSSPGARHVPLGVNVESVSINRDEIDASVDLVHALGEVLRGAPGPL